MSDPSTAVPGQPADPATTAAAGVEPEPVRPEPSADRADAIVKTGVIAAMGLGLVPVPVFDMLAVVTINLHTIRELARHHAVDFEEVLTRSIVLSLVGSALPLVATAGLSSMLKVIPGIGSLAGGASMSILSGAITYAIGRTFQQHFAGGGSLLDFNTEEAQRSFETLIEQGRTAVRTWQKDASPPPEPRSDGAP